MAVFGGKVLLAMSGGVDSSVAAALLRDRGYEVVGCFMRLGSPGEELDTPRRVDTHAGDDQSATCSPTKIGKQGCCSINDAADARLVAGQLGIPFYVCNFKKDFGRIMDYFASEYGAGRTPNPCVRCNDWLKFGKLHEYAEQLGCDFVASGHYARVAREPSQPARLLRGLDRSKDQSYVLFGVPRGRLEKMLLPIGELEKPEVRRLAERYGLPVFDKPDSQEICFVPDRDYAGFLERRDGELRREGRLLDESGATIGTHDGQHRFTLGQRRGLGITVGIPLYVIDRNAAENTVTLGARERLLSGGCIGGEANWLVSDAEMAVLRDWTACWSQHRYNTQPVRARVRVIDGESAKSYSGRTGRFEVEFETPRESVTPGQAIVIYAGDSASPDDGPTRVLGGGWIESTTPTSAMSSTPTLPPTSSR
jgi:tRNA-specific 2-thiouridylase